MIDPPLCGRMILSASRLHKNVPVRLVSRTLKPHVQRRLSQLEIHRSAARPGKAGVVHQDIQALEFLQRPAEKIDYVRAPKSHPL